MSKRFLENDLLRSIGAFGSAQAVGQLLSFISGLLIVRFLIPDQYALYTMANAMVATLNVLADSGISKGALAQGGRVWRSPRDLGAVMVTSMQLRRKFAGVATLLALPILVFLLLRHGSSWLEAIAIVLGVLLMFQIVLTTAMYDVVLQLHQEVKTIGVIRLKASLLRVLTIAGACFAAPLAFVVVCAGIPPQVWANRRLRTSVNPHVDWKQSADKAVASETLALVRRILPGSIYYCINGQLIVFLISIFGSTMAIAQVGALSRLSQLTILISAVSSVVIIPRFSRMQTTRKILPTFFGVLSTIAALCGVFLVMVAAFSDEALWLLGTAYAGLRVEMLMAMAAACLSLLSGTAYALGASRGWVAPPWLSIGLNVSLQVILISALDLSTVRNVLTFAMLTAVVPLSVHATYVVWRAKKQAGTN